jgi:hypothetical protein
LRVVARVVQLPTTRTRTRGRCAFARVHLSCERPTQKRERVPRACAACVC